MGNRAPRLALYLLLVVLFLDVLAPTLVGYGANWALGEVLASDTSVELSARPRAKLLLGIIDDLQVELQGLQAKGGVVVDRLLVRASSLRFDLKSLFLEREFRILAPLTMSVRAELGEEALSRVWREHALAGMAGPVIVGGELMAFFVRLPVLGSEVQVRLEGTPRLVYEGADPVLELVPVDVYAEGRRLPEPIRSVTLGLINPELLRVPLDVGLGVHWSRARTEPGKLILEGVIDRQARELVLPLAGR